MNALSFRSLLALLACCVLVTGSLFLVWDRSTRPQWLPYQQRGVSLSLERIETELTRPTSQERQNELRARLDELRSWRPRIIEVRPFDGKLPSERCLTCHFGIEDLSDSHPNSVFGCVICHGGNGPDLTVTGAHLGLRGGRNPARLDLAPKSCGTTRPDLGACHSGRNDALLDRVTNVPRSLMATNAGIISILRFQWGLSESSAPEFGIRSVTDGATSLKAMPHERLEDGGFSLANSHFRKFCAACHLWTPRHRENMGRLQGCPACHAPYGTDGRYQGCDPTIDREEIGHPETHTMTNLIPDERCRACHNRSARVGLNYHGQMESAQYGTPFVEGRLNDYTLPDDRFVLRLTPDIHHEKGMGCIDCHTGQDTMGDGTIYGHMAEQIEIRCEDCHGTGNRPPRTVPADPDDPLIQALVSYSPFITVDHGDHILVTSKGRPLPHVKRTPKGVVLTSKLSGKAHPVTDISTKKTAHRIKGHERLDCDACHSAWSPQCYGCHQYVDFRHQGLDHMTKQRSEPRWAEGRTHFRFARHIYGINSTGKVGILVPGCQVWNTVVDSDGSVIPPYDSKIMRLRNGMTSIAMGPIHPHTTRSEVPRCVGCHFDPKALGLGEGRMRWSRANGGALKIEPIYQSHASGLKIDYPLDAAVTPAGEPLQSDSHAAARPFNADEIRRIVGIAPCLACHDRYDDPVWAREGPYKMTSACRRALEQGLSMRPAAEEP